MNARPTRKRPLLALYPLWQWLVYVPAVALATLLAALMTVPLAVLVSQRAANLWVAVPWCHLLRVLVPMRLDIEGLEHVDPTQSYVVVANHQSQFDIPVIYGYSGLDLRWVMKAELGRVPFIAAGCRAIGHIFIDRSDPDQARAAITRALARLQPGTGVLFFAEGTRSRDGRLLPFKKGAFRSAIDRQLPVLPITVTGTRDILPSGSRRIRPGRARMIIHRPVPTDGLAPDGAGELRRRVRTAIASALPAGKDASRHATATA